MSKIKVVKVDPLEISSTLVWHIAGLLQAPLKDFVIYIDDKENIMYVNKTKKIPKKDIDGFVEVIMFPYYWVGDYETGKGDFLDYVYDTYGWPACKALHDSHGYRIKTSLYNQAEQLSETITPIIEEELRRTNVNEMLLYHISQHGRAKDRKTHYNMVSYNDNYIFMLGFLAGAGKIAADGVFSIEEDFDEESEG